jgi:hypothetical protein
MPRLTARGGPLLALVLILLAPVCSRPTIADDATPIIRILEPADGAVVSSPVTVRVEIANFILQAPGSGTKTNAGHIHYWIDDRTDATIYPATIRRSVRLLVPPGRHKIRAELVQDDHTSLADGHRDKKLNALPDTGAFEHRSSMSTVTVEVR